MFDSLFKKLTVFNDDIHRNIATVAPAEHLFDDLSDQAGAWAAAGDVITQAKDADSFRSLIILRPFQYGKSVYGSISPRMATRFSDGRQYGVLYGSLEMETTIYETVYHWLKFLHEAGIDRADIAVETQRRLFKIAVNGLLVDLRGQEVGFPELLSPTSYHFTHQVGAYLHAQAQRGLIVASARCTGTNVVIFSDEILSNVRHQMYLTYLCNMSKKIVTVTMRDGKIILSAPFASFGIN